MQWQTLSFRPSFPSALMFVLGVAAGLLPAQGATYYVAKNGNDANPCTQAQPCLTITRGSKVATAAGSIVQVEAGTYNETVTLTTSGSVAGKIIFRGHDGTGCPTVSISDVNSRGARPNPSVSMQGFSINSSYVAMDCFRIIGTGGAGFDIGTDQSNIDITDNWIDATATPGSPWVGINMPDGKALANMPSYVYAARNYIVNTVYGLLVHCKTNCTFEDNEVFQMKNASRNAGNDNDYSRVFGEYVTMRHNYFHGNTIADCYGADCHIDCFQTWNIGQTGEVARHITLDRNVCFNSHEGIIARDTSSGTAGSYSSHYDWTVTNNIFSEGPIGAGNSWCALFEHVGQVVFSNNLCANAALVGYVNGAQGVHRNNIHYATGWQPYTASVSSWSNGSVTADHNLLYESGRTYSGYSSDIINKNPLFSSPSGYNFRLLAGSPATDAGASVGITKDMDGKPRPQGTGFDIGPFEFGTGGTTTPPAPATSLTISVR